VKRGLVIGKFMPAHEGHIALIRFAALNCDQVIVSMSYKIDDPIPGDLRFEWLKEIFKNDSAIVVEQLKDDFDDESLELNQRTKRWAHFISKCYPPIDIVFSSESYGTPFARHLNAEHLSFDETRSRFPVSASLIRKNPFQYWDYIPASVRPYFVKKVCFYGPESTGKSTMAKKMAAHFDTEFVPEVAREFVTSNVFTVEDIALIAQEHYNRIVEKTRTANKLLLCDTDAITTAIYSKHYLNTVPQVVYDLEKKVSFDLYFLFDIDVEWVADELRDLGDRRGQMFNIFKNELAKRNIPFTLISGSYEEREQKVIKKLNDLLT
jgi:HTH-type transcriptional repressor of NAD biosynthesis genes